MTSIHRAPPPAPRRHPRWPAVVGAVILWGTAGVAALPPGGRVFEWATPLGQANPLVQKAMAAEPPMPVAMPPAEPLRFLFAKGSSELVWGDGAAAEANSRAFERLFGLDARLTGLTARRVWVASADTATAMEQIRAMGFIVEGMAQGRERTPRLPWSEDPPKAVAAGDAAYDVLELRLEVASKRRDACPQALELVDPGLPTAVDGSPLRLTLNGVHVKAGPRAIWRERAASDAPGPWLSWDRRSGEGHEVATMSKDVSDYFRPWDGRTTRVETHFGGHDQACAVKIELVRG